MIRLILAALSVSFLIYALQYGYTEPQPLPDTVSITPTVPDTTDAKGRDTFNSFLRLQNKETE